jgi:ArsR family transcriptional regulator
MKKLNGNSPLEMGGKAETVAGFLKGIANSHRLLILCELATGEKSVGELSEATGVSQTSMSQHLAKLKKEKIVDFRRDHRTLYYSISNEPVVQIMAILYQTFCVGKD